MSNFKRPDSQNDKRQLQSTSGINWEEAFWKPKVGENVIRILPARSDAPDGVSYHLKVSKHFLSFGPKAWEVFPCNQEMFGLPCPVCEKRIELYKSTSKEDKELASTLRVSSSGIFNIIDRTDPNPVVKLYEASYGVWFKIVQLASSGGRFSNLIFEEGPEGEVLGRDLLLIYNDKAPAQQRYQVMPDERSVLGTDEEIERWMGEMILLTPEAFWKPVDYNEAYLRAFGTDEDRQMLKEARESSRKSKSDGDSEFPPKEEKSASEAKPVTKPAAAPKPTAPKPKPEPKPEPKAEPAAKPAPAEEKKAAEAPKGDMAARIRARVAAAREATK